MAENQNSLPRILALLRKERGLSQKAAAAELGISQALLSHYENGIRECGLSFLIKAAEYYGVSCDYLLGLSPERRPESGTDRELSFTPKDNVFRGSVIPALGKALTVSSVNVIFGLLSSIKDKELSSEIQKYFSFVVYRLFRHLYAVSFDNSELFFGVDSASFTRLADAAQSLCEARLNRAAALCEKGTGGASYDELCSRFGKDASAILNIIKNTEAELLKLYRR